MQRNMTSRGSKLSREEYRQRQDIDAARKAGTMPAEVDSVSGKEINPHIPQYISEAPWYLDSGLPTLQHQKASTTEHNDKISDWYLRGGKSVRTATY